MKRLAIALALALALAIAPTVASAATNDPLFGQQWSLGQINAEPAWATSTGAGATIAILDTGVDLDHPDLAGKIAGGATFIGCTETGPCGNGDWESGGEVGTGHPHGTHVAGSAAAITGNGEGIAGVAPDSSLLAVKVLGADGGTFDEIAAGIRWATDNGADVINMSLGALPGAQALAITGALDATRDAVAYAVANGVTVVAAAGNDFASICGEPAFDPNILCVVSTDRNELRSAFSNFAIDGSITNAVAAPGGAAFLSCADDVISTVPVGSEGACGAGTPGYDAYAGTSMATPHVAGVAALLHAQGRSNLAVVDALKATAHNPVTGLRGVWDPVYGHGIVDAAAAVAD